MVRGRIYDPGACIGKGGHIEGRIGGRGSIYDPGVRFGGGGHVGGRIAKLDHFIKKI